MKYKKNKIVKHEVDGDTNCSWSPRKREWMIIGEIKTIKITALLKSARIRRGVLMKVKRLVFTQNSKKNYQSWCEKFVRSQIIVEICHNSNTLFIYEWNPLPRLKVNL